MRIKFGSNIAKAFVMAFLIGSFCALSVSETRAQDTAQSISSYGPAGTLDLATKTVEPAPAKKPETVEEQLSALHQLLEQQSLRLNQLEQTVAQQQETIRLLALHVEPSASSTVTTARRIEPVSDGPQTPSVEDRLKKVESSVSQLGNIKFSGDIRLRSESIFGQSNTLASGANPLAFGNELTPRHRMRLRARLTMRGSTLVALTVQRAAV